MSEPAAAFRALHAAPTPLLLANVWDAGSARLVEACGAPALATSSAGVAWSLGYADGDRLPWQEHLAALRRMRRVTRGPLSVDIESGYSAQPQQVAEHVRQLIDLGVVGINLQDGEGGADLLASKIDAVRSVAVHRGVDLYINARCDLYLQSLRAGLADLDGVLARAARYHAAGADGLFLLGMTDPAQIARVAAATPLKLNLVVWPGLAPLAELAALGVRRLSAGSWLPQTALGICEPLVRAFLETGAHAPLCASAAPYAHLNALF